MDGNGADAQRLGRIALPSLQGGGKRVMMTKISLRRFTVRALGLLVLVSAMVLGGKALGQNPQPQLPKITYTKNTIFHLPVQMEERTRASLREVCLYVKSGSADWVRQETGSPTMSHFSYKVPHDGEYWFSLVTIDKAGRMTPADVSQEPPGLRVMVDTQAPVIDVQPWTSPEGDFCLRCQIQDANPDPNSLKAVYRDQMGEHGLDAIPGNPNVFKIVGRELLNQPLRIIAADLCGKPAVGSRGDQRKGNGGRRLASEQESGPGFRLQRSPSLAEIGDSTGGRRQDRGSNTRVFSAAAPAGQEPKPPRRVSANC